MVPLKYQKNFWRTLEMLLINCEINLILIWSASCFLVTGTAANQVQKFTIAICNRFKQTAKTKSWFKSNTTN